MKTIQFEKPYAFLAEKTARDDYVDGGSPVVESRVTPLYALREETEQ